MKIKKMILFLCVAIILLSSCTDTKTPDAVTETTVDTSVTSDTSQEIENVSPVTTSNYDKIHFGETQDILLLDIEWYTIEEYEQAMIDDYGPFEEEPEWLIRDRERLNNKELYIAKTINGKNSILFSSNPYNNKYDDDPLADSQIDPDGYYIYNMYPLSFGISYEENGEWLYKDYIFTSEKDFSIIANDLSKFCDDLLAEGKITQEAYNWYNIKSPLDYYVRQNGWFNEEDLKNYPLEKYDFPPTPELIKDKKEFNILFVGNSLVYSGSMPKQVADLARIYGITVNHESIAPGGAILSDNMKNAIENVQNNKYDYVIFQDGGDLPVNNTTAFLSNVEQFTEEVLKSGAIPVLYNPAWVNINRKPAKDAQASLTASYEKAAKMYGTLIVNAGEVWVYAYDKHPELKLYADDVHANNTGAYLTACTIVSTLFDIHVKDIDENNTYHGDDAIKLGQAAWEYVQYYNEHKISPDEIITVPDGTNERIASAE